MDSIISAQVKKLFGLRITTSAAWSVTRVRSSFLPLLDLRYKFQSGSAHEEAIASTILNTVPTDPKVLRLASIPPPVKSCVRVVKCEEEGAGGRDTTLASLATAGLA